MKNTVWYGVTSQLCDTVLLVAAFCTIVPEYSSVITRTFPINTVIVVVISHILSAIYWNSNESFAGTSGCNGGILLKVHNFHWSHTCTKDENVVVIGKLLKASI